MTKKPVEMILRFLAERSNERAYPGGAIGKKPSWAVDPFKVLISTILSQRTRDECTHVASERLFAAYPDPTSLAVASPDHLDELIGTVNFHFGKAKAIKQVAIIIHEQYEDRVPDELDELLALPMVGLKTANCVLSYGFGKDAICVDTHVHRISNRIGLISTKTPDESEEKLREVVPRPLWRDVNSIMVRFGQEVCTPINPKHELCPITSFCDHYQALLKGKDH
jgi:endonuclease III